MDLLPKYLNEIQDANKMKRCAAYKKLSELIRSKTLVLPPAEAFSVIRVCLKGFEDASERCREEAVELTTMLLNTQDASVLDWILPSIVTRIGVAPVAEESEEVRLRLLQLAHGCMHCFPHDIGPRNYIDFFQVLLDNCFKDPFPDLKKEACRVAAQLCAIEPKQMKAIAVPIAKALRGSCLLHKHGAVRAEAARTLAVLFRHGASEVLTAAKDEPESRTTAAMLFILCNDHAESVRLAALSVLSTALLDITERLDQHRTYLPHLMLLATDAFEVVALEAQRVLEQVGKLYLMDNEDNRIDLAKRRVSMKDIEWYGDDEYPNMTLHALQHDGARQFSVLDRRPSLGARYAVAESARNFLTRLLDDISAVEWIIPFSNNNRKVVALRILWMAMYFCERSTVQYAERILGALYKALRDDDHDVLMEARLCVEILGKFLTPSQYLPFLIAKPTTTTTTTTSSSTHADPNEDEEEENGRQIRKMRGKTIVLTSAEHPPAPESTPTLFSTAAVATKCSILLALGCMLQGSEEHLTAAQATQVTQALTSDDIIDSDHEELLRALLTSLETVFAVFAERHFISSPTHPLPPSVLQDANQRTLDSMLFYALLRLKSSDIASVRQHAVANIGTLSTLVTGSAQGIYDLHISRLLHRYGAMMPVVSFADLVLTAAHPRHNLGELLTQLFLARLGQVDLSLRITEELRYFGVLEQLLWADSEIFARADLVVLVRGVVVPHASFQPGNAAHLFRKTAINCLCALAREHYRELLLPAMEEEDCGLANKVLTLWCSASDSDDGEMRLVCLATLPQVLRLPMSAGTANEVVQSILLRFDDANEIIRLRTAVGLAQALRGREESAPLPATFVAELSAQMVPLVKKMLVYLDDEDEKIGIRPALMEALQQLGDVSPHIVMDLVRGAMAKHLQPQLYCEPILQYITQRHQ